MQYFRVVLVCAAVVISGGCVQFSTVLNLKADGSGTIQQRLLFTQAAIAQLRQFMALSGGTASFDPLSEQQARDAAASLGPGVTYVSSTPLDLPGGVGRDMTYAFTDIGQLTLDPSPPAPGGMPVAPAGAGDRVSFKLTRQDDGHSLLRIVVPPLPALGGADGSPGIPSADQIAMLKPMFAGARLSIAIEPAGRIVRTSTPHVAGGRVVLLDVDVDAVLADETLLQRLQAARTPEETKTILTNLPGLKVNLDPEITIEFE
jgi:hypothetical protein